MQRRHRFARATAAASVVATLLGQAVASAQSADPELSCVPDTVVAGGTVTCDVAGVAASAAVDLELRDGATVVATADGVASTAGAATIALSIPTSARIGTLAVALVGTAVTVDLTVDSPRPTTISAGVGPSRGDVERTLPASAVLAMGLLLGLAAVPGLRRRGTRVGA